MRYILLAILFCTACFNPSSNVVADASECLNILLITADDLGLQLSCYGDKVIQTPNLDRLAASGTLFDVAYVAQASCSPSRSAMFTGLFPHTNGQDGLTNSGGFKMHPKYHKATIPAYLKKAGYRTGIIGKLHVGPENVFRTASLECHWCGLPDECLKRYSILSTLIRGDAVCQMLRDATTRGGKKHDGSPHTFIQS